MDVREALSVVAGGRTLVRAEAEDVMGRIMAGEATPAQLGALLSALHLRGETVEEVAGFAAGLRRAAIAVRVPAGAIDVVGTGGDRSNTFNISTVSGIVAAAAGATVAKHGNRAASSACGSADVLEALGVRIELGPESVAACVAETGIGFMFAPRFHPALRHAGPVRREIGIRTVFNILGPLANPAGVTRMVLGVPSVAIGETMARVLLELGAEQALVVHGADGLDEISPAGPTRTWTVRGGEVQGGTIDPGALGLPPATLDEIRGGDPQRNAVMAREVLGGAPGARRAAVLLNAGAACLVAGLVGDLRGGLDLAARTIDSGAAVATLEAFAASSQRLGRAEDA